MRRGGRKLRYTVGLVGSKPSIYREHGAIKLVVNGRPFLRLPVMYGAKYVLRDTKPGRCVLGL